MKQVPLPVNRSVLKTEPPKKDQDVKTEVKQAPAAASKQNQKSEKKPDKKDKKDKPTAAAGGKEWRHITVTLLFLWLLMYTLLILYQNALIIFERGSIIVSEEKQLCIFFWWKAVPYVSVIAFNGHLQVIYRVALVSVKYNH